MMVAGLASKIGTLQSPCGYAKQIRPHHLEMTRRVRSPLDHACAHALRDELIYFIPQLTIEVERFDASKTDLIYISWPLHVPE